MELRTPIPQIPNLGTPSATQHGPPEDHQQAHLQHPPRPAVGAECSCRATRSIRGHDRMHRCRRYRCLAFTGRSLVQARIKTNQTTSEGSELESSPRPGQQAPKMKRDPAKWNALEHKAPKPPEAQSSPRSASPPTSKLQTHPQRTCGSSCFSAPPSWHDSGLGRARPQAHFKVPTAAGTGTAEEETSHKSDKPQVCSSQSQ